MDLAGLFFDHFAPVKDPRADNHARRKRAGWDNKYLLKVLMSDFNLKNKD